MEQKNKLKPRLLLNLVAGGYVIYQGITLFESLITNDSSFSQNFIFYIFSGFFVLSGLLIFYYVYRSYQKQRKEINDTNQLDKLNQTEYEARSEDKIDE